MGIGARTQVDNRVVVADITTQYWALIAGRVVDALSRVPVPDMAVRAAWHGIFVKTTPDGYFALAGYPEWVFPHLDSTSYAVDVTVTAPGYYDASFPVAIPQGASLPVPVGAPTALRHLPVRLQGRVVSEADPSVPIADALVLVVDAQPMPPGAVALATGNPLAFAHAAGITVRERALLPSGAAKQLTVGAHGGSKMLALSDRAGLTSGDILRIGAAAAVEFAIVASVAATPANMALPGEVTLVAPLDHMAAHGTTVQPVTAGAASASAQLAASARAGEAVLILDQMIGGAMIELADPDPGRVEYRALGARSDADGLYHLGGIAGVSRVGLAISAAGHTAKPLTRIVLYDQPANVVDVRLA